MSANPGQTYHREPDDVVVHGPFPGIQPEEEINEETTERRGRHAQPETPQRRFTWIFIMAAVVAVILAIGGFLFGESSAENEALREQLSASQDEAASLAADIEAMNEADLAEDEAFQGQIDRLQGEVDRRIDPGVHAETVEDLATANGTLATQADQIRELNQSVDDLTAAELAARANAETWRQGAELQSDINQGLRGTIGDMRDMSEARLEAALDDIVAHTESGDWINMSFRYTPPYTEWDFGVVEVPIGREEYDFHGLGTVEYGLASDTVNRSRSGDTEIIELQMPVLLDSYFKNENIDEDSRLWVGASTVQVFTGTDTSRRPLNDYANEQLELAACQNATLLRRQADAVTEQINGATYGMDVQIVWRDRLGGSHTTLSDQLLVDNAC